VLPSAMGSAPESESPRTPSALTYRSSSRWRCTRDTRGTPSCLGTCRTGSDSTSSA
jgi:hypothetical protein